MMAQAVGVMQFVEAGGLAAAHPVEGGAPPGNFATAFDSAASQADDASKLQVETPTVQPTIVLAPPTVAQPSQQRRTLEPLMPSAGSQTDESRSKQLPSPTLSGEKLVAIPPEAPAAFAAITNTVAGSPSLPVARAPLSVCKETGLVSKKTASVEMHAASTKIVPADALPINNAQTITVPAALVNLAASLTAPASSDTPASGQACQTSPLQVSGTPVSVIPLAPAVLAVAVPQSQKALKVNIAEGTKQTAKPIAISGKSGVAPIELPELLPSLICPVESVTTLVVQSAQSSPADPPSTSAPLLLLQTDVASNPTTPVSAVRFAASDSVGRVMTGQAKVALAEQSSGEDVTGASLSSVRLGSVDRTASNLSKSNAEVLTKQGSDSASGVTTAVTTAISSAQIVVAVPFTASLTSTAVGHPSVASDLSAAINVPVSATMAAFAPQGGLAHTTLSAGPTTLEVGVASGTHGWLKIRAELTSTGEVNASLTGGSPVAASKLRNELPALSSYLRSEQVQVSGLAVHAALHATVLPAGTAATILNSDRPDQGSTDSFSAGADAHSRKGQAEQQTDPRGQGVLVSPGIENGVQGTPQRSSNPAAYEDGMGLGDGSRLSSIEYGSGGDWLNVRV